MEGAAAAPTAAAAAHIMQVQAAAAAAAATAPTAPAAAADAAPADEAGAVNVVERLFGASWSETTNFPGARGEQVQNLGESLARQVAQTSAGGKHEG